MGRAGSAVCTAVFAEPVCCPCSLCSEVASYLRKNEEKPRQVGSAHCAVCYVDSALIRIEENQALLSLLLSFF